jgi:thymidylate synthase (FAD)
MTAKLLDHTKLSNAAIAGRTAYQSWHKGGQYELATDDITIDDYEFLDRLINKLKHESIAEQIVYNISIKGFSRAVLQQWSRNRIMSQTVMSTRYVNPNNFSLYSTPNEELNTFIGSYFDELLAKFGHLSNDVLKYGYPEALLTENVVQINMRELLHVFELRMSKHAMAEYQDLAWLIYWTLPPSHRKLYERVLPCHHLVSIKGLV